MEDSAKEVRPDLRKASKRLSGGLRDLEDCERKDRTEKDGRYCHIGAGGREKGEEGKFTGRERRWQRCLAGARAVALAWVSMCHCM